MRRQVDGLGLPGARRVLDRRRQRLLAHVQEDQSQVINSTGNNTGNQDPAPASLIHAGRSEPGSRTQNETEISKVVSRPHVSARSQGQNFGFTTTIWRQKFRSRPVVSETEYSTPSRSPDLVLHRSSKVGSRPPPVVDRGR